MNKYTQDMTGTGDHVELPEEKPKKKTQKKKKNSQKNN